MKKAQKALLALAVIAVMVLTVFGASAGSPPAFASNEFGRIRDPRFTGITIERPEVTYFTMATPTTTYFTISTPTPTFHTIATPITEFSTPMPVVTGHIGKPIEITTPTPTFASVHTFPPEPEATVVSDTSTPMPVTTASTALLPTITKDPTDETVMEGGDCWFIANYTNAINAVWHFISPDGLTDYRYDDAAVAASFPGLKIDNGMYSNLHLSNIPYALNGWRVTCEYSNSYGAVRTNTATVYVQPLASGVEAVGHGLKQPVLGLAVLGVELLQPIFKAQIKILPDFS